ncbi:MAG TPA: AIPR family protein [Paludibacteraceae bacterium]|nr:AIPR family protein [Paludibacteraceae bacterium]
MNELNKFYQSLMQEVSSRQLANEDGDTQEQTFTRFVVDMLSEAGETENADIAFDEKELGKKGQHKINAYAIADNYETVDLFISIFEPSDTIQTIAKTDIDRAATRITNYFRKSIYGDYANDVAESSPIFEFTNTLANFKELKDSLVRVNVFIITNGEYKGDIPANSEISGYKIFYRVLDIKYLYQISEQSRVPIEINFEEEDFEIPCLSANSDNDDYQAYIAIIPGLCLANLYERFGARLLEQNVRSFLQFTGKINKGIRETIKNEPQMFLAFNNGIAATADHIELDETSRYIRKISNLQIVNGGQTTASIYHTAKKDKADVSKIFVQVKFSVIKSKDDFSEVVSRISRYANTQNKVNDADFTANNPNLVAFEKLSRYILTPVTAQNNMQTFWFFERARGQYKNLRQKEGFTKSRQKAFDLKYPKNQMFTKVELAKYINAYQEVYDGKKLAIGPHIVVRGNEKNYARFINDNLPENIKKINNVFFEDSIAKAILFKSADKRYGTKVSGNNIGEMKNVVVPYTISLLNIITDDKLDLYRIWKNQHISTALSDFIYDLMKQVNQFILDEYAGQHYIEQAKKEDCWNKVKNHAWSFNINDIKADLIDEKNPPKRNIVADTEDAEETMKHENGIIRSIPVALWKKIADWGQGGYLSVIQQTAARDTASKIKYNHKFTDSDRRRAISVYEKVCQYNIELLEEADKLAEKEQTETPEKQATTSNAPANDITLELVEKMVAWDKRRRILEDWKWRAMDDVVQGRKPFSDRMKYAFYFNLEKLKKAGFTE